MEDVFPAMAAADAVAISAPIHALGRTAVEGMLLGKPVVYPLRTGFDDYLEDGVTGLGYVALDPHAMANRCISFHPRPTRRLLAASEAATIRR
jgi:glycosyltransferase involved in cell wall biosynthesis